MLGPLNRVFPNAAARRQAAEDQKRAADAARKTLVRRTRGMIQKLDDQIAGLDQKRRESHDAARRALAAGDSASAQRHVLSVRQKMLLIETVEKKRFVFEHAAVMTEVSVSEREMTELMVEMARVNHVDPVRIEQALQGVMASIERGREGEDIWDEMSKAQIRDLGLTSSTVPSTDKLLQDLASEVAQGIRTGYDLASTAPGDAAMKQRIGEGRARLNRLVGGIK
ncbi:MAG: hypothetical protein O9325_22620, partial [Roseomonas sp.]|nr:hypothetical protein [Roseomonas sp.]